MEKGFLWLKISMRRLMFCYVQQPRLNQGKGPKIEQINTTIGLPYCVVCGKFHDGECRKGAGLYYRCGKHGHFIKNYPEPAND